MSKIFECLSLSVALSLGWGRAAGLEPLSARRVAIRLRNVYGDGSILFSQWDVIKCVLKAEQDSRRTTEPLFYEEVLSNLRKFHLLEEVDRRKQA